MSDPYPVFPGKFYKIFPCQNKIEVLLKSGCTHLTQQMDKN